MRILHKTLTVLQTSKMRLITYSKGFEFDPSLIHTTHLYTGYSIHLLLYVELHCREEPKNKGLSLHNSHTVNA